MILWRDVAGLQIENKWKITGMNSAVPHKNQEIDKDGYKRISLKIGTISGKQFMQSVVLWTFHGPPPDDLKIGSEMTIVCQICNG